MRVLQNFNKKLAICALTAFCSMSANSSSTNVDDMQAFFNEVGVLGNAQTPGNFKGQTRNYLTGGSLQVRIPQKTYQFATFDKPRMNASCAGIDIYGGSFSYINSDQLVSMLQNIGNSAKGALFSLALNSISPELKAEISQWMDSLQKMNEFNINSCKAAEGIVTASALVGSKKGFMNTVKGLGTQGFGLGGDWAAMGDLISKSAQDPAQDGAGEVVAEVAADTSGAVSDSGKLGVSGGNILYQALDKLSVDGSTLTNDEKALIQAILGTVILRPDSTNGETELVMIEVGATMPDPMAALLTESVKVEYKIRQCEPYVFGGHTYSVNDCVKLSNTATPVEKKSISGVIKEKIDKVRDGLKNNTAITAADYNVINLSHLPMWSIMIDEYRTGVYSQMDSSRTIIALDYVKAILQRTSRAVMVSMYALNKADSPAVTNAVKRMREKIDALNKNIALKESIFFSKHSAFMTAKNALAMESSRVRQITQQRLSMTKQSMMHQ
ncbi:MAG: hypothetical protein AUK56_05500 [Thiomicrospira sp. CG2_30_44_34]|nr:MAG: hypothetical protein AUK56_05500 [Thiomicrospira sp. CG2_30_44_34]